MSSACLPCDTLVAEVPLGFSVDGALGTIGVGGSELLRDLGGGGSEATAKGREIVERAAAGAGRHARFGQSD